MIDSFARDDADASCRWDYVILDEGHIIKNPATKQYKAMQRLATRHKILMTGTPIQNHLEEFWALMDWVTNGSVFGDKKTFSIEFAVPIVKAQDPQVRNEDVLLLVVV